MGKRPGMLVAIGVVVLIVGAGIVALVLRSDSNSSTKSAQVAVLVATKPIRAGEDGATAASAGKFMTKEVPENQAAGSVGSVASVTGSMFTANVASGQIISQSVLQAKGARPTSLVVPKGHQAVAVTVEYTAAGAGYVTVGDHVSVFSVISASGSAAGLTPFVRLLIPRAEVLDVSAQALPLPGSATTVAASAAPQTLTLLLSLTPDQAEQAAFASSFDKLYMSILAPGETPGPTPGVSYGHNYVAQS